MAHQMKNSDTNRKFSAEVTSLDSWSDLTGLGEDDHERNNKEKQTSSGQSKKHHGRKKSNSHKHDKHSSGIHIDSENVQNPVILNPKNLTDLITEDKYQKVNCMSSSSSGTSNKEGLQTSKEVSSGCQLSDLDTMEEEFLSLDCSSLPLSLNRNTTNFKNDYLRTCGETSKLKSKSSQGLNSKTCDNINSWPERNSDPLQPNSLPPDLNQSTYLLTDDVDQAEKVKNKLMSVWNNMKYGWTIKTKTAFKCDSPIFLLGTCYHIRPSDEEARPGERKRRPPNVEMFKQDFASQIWFTYRQDFPQIPGTKMTSDCGWGCMLRSGQMMLARAFLTHFLGRDWNVFHAQSRENDTYRRQIIRWFGDFPSENSPFSIHQLVEAGKSHGKQPGEWYGPSSVAFILRDAMVKALETQPLLADIGVYVAQDCTVYKQDVYELCSSRGRAPTEYSISSDSTEEKIPIHSEKDWKRAAIILIPVRLGGEELNPVYIPCIKSLLAQDCCIGIMGGKPKTSLYFVGWQDEKVIYLDPHYCQDAVDTRERNFAIQTFHCLSPRKISLSKMDPSCTIGFYCRTREEFDKFVQQTEEMISPPKQKLSYPMFVFSEGNSTDANMHCDDYDKEDRLLRVKHYKMDQYGRIRSKTEESEEFVVL